MAHTIDSDYHMAHACAIWHTKSIVSTTWHTRVPDLPVFRTTYTSDLSIVKVDLAKADIWNVLLNWTRNYTVETQI